MKGKSVKKIITRRILPAVLAASMVIGIAEWKNLRFVNASQSTSLPGIESLKSNMLLNGGSFNILEVVPSGDPGSLGYYVSGKEPFEFESVIKAINTKDEREKWANNSARNLVDKGFASTTKDTAPLYVHEVNGNSLYKEYYPWDTVNGDYNTLILNKEDRAKVNANVNEVGDGKGAYSATATSYVYKEDGDYLQKVSFNNPINNLGSFFSTQDQFMAEKDNYVFYKPIFKKINKETADQTKDEIDNVKRSSNIVTFSEENNLPIFTKLDTGDYQFDLAASEDHEFQVGTIYYAIEKYEGIQMGKDTTASLNDLKRDGWYASQIDTDNGFRKKQWNEKGSFSLNLETLKYVGEGNGAYTLNTVAGGRQYTVIYNSIRYQGGYENNNWLLRKVFDYNDSSDFNTLSDKISIDTVSAEEQFPTDLSRYGLVVISTGSNGGKVTLTDTMKTAISSYANDKGAVLFDTAALDDVNGFAAQLGVDANTVSDNKTNPYGLVAKNVYAFREGQDSYKNIVTTDFVKSYNADLFKNKGTSFNEVYADLVNQNFLRKQKNKATRDLFDTERISMADALRYIINFRYSAGTSGKDHIRILDIEPGDTSAITDPDEVSTNITLANGQTQQIYFHHLKDEYLKDWFGNTYGKDKVWVTSMSTRTLAGKIEDISENYDMVYIGSGTDTSATIKDINKKYNELLAKDNSKKDGLMALKTIYVQNAKTDGPLVKSVILDDGTKQNVTDDDDMVGLVYYNIGDQMTYDQHAKIKADADSGVAVIAGLKDKDYKVVDDNPKLFNNDTAKWNKTVRYSGNDLTRKKKTELESFIKAGHPVIISDGLMEATTQQNTTVNVAVNLIENRSGNSVTYTASAGIVNGGTDKISDVMYQWYRRHQISDGKYEETPIEGATGTDYTFTQNNDDDDKYFCKASGFIYHGRRIILDDDNQPYSKYINVKNYVSTEGDQRNANVDIPAYKYDGVKTSAVDYYSKMYSLLSSNVGAGNVWSSREAKDNSATVLQYMNISSPRIVFEKKADGTPDCPPAYSENIFTGGAINQALCLKDTLEMSFRVINSTDPSIDRTTYTADIYFDKNGDGLYTDDEKADDVFVAEDGTEDNQVNSIKAVPSEDSTGGGYSLAVILPEDMTGAVNWKLKVTQNPDSGDDTTYMPHASFSEVSYKQAMKADGTINVSAKENITILQVNADGRGDWYNLETSQKNWANKKTETVKGVTKPETDENIFDYDKNHTDIANYGKFLNKPQVTDHYNIVIVTISARDFCTQQYPGDKTWTEEQKKRLTKDTADPDKVSSKINLDDYDMIILGFGDSYGTLAKSACDTIKKFAAEGKSVLFTHDNSLTEYLPYKDTYSQSGTDNRYINAYKVNPEVVNKSFNFNTGLRDLDKMDVYGATDSEDKIKVNWQILPLGGVHYWQLPGLDQWQSGLLAQQDNNQEMDPATAREIEATGHSVAYKPSSHPDTSKILTVPETDGFSDYILNRIRTNDDGTDVDRYGESLSARASITNRGTITSYPYDIKGEDNRGNHDTISISTTHAQYNQLNMNSDDIVVWATIENSESNDKISGTNSFYKKSDAVNNYYLFSCGNIYYTGAGDNTETTEYEAKLFINLMIAAYRQGNSKPRAYFTGSAKSSKQISTYLVNGGDSNVNSIDILREFIEEFSGIDTDKYVESQNVFNNKDDFFRQIKPCAPYGASTDANGKTVFGLGLTEDELDGAAKAAAIEMAYLVVDDEESSKSTVASPAHAKGRAESLQRGPTIDASGDTIDDEKAEPLSNQYGIKYVNRDSTVDGICKAIDRIISGKMNPGTVVGTSTDRESLRKQKFYFTVRDNNNSANKTIDVRFYLYSDNANEDSAYKQIDGEDGYYLDITNKVHINNSGTDKTVKANRVNSMRLYENWDNGAAKAWVTNPVIDELVKNKTATIAIRAITKIDGKETSGPIQKLKINTSEMLLLG